MRVLLMMMMGRKVETPWQQQLGENNKRANVWGYNRAYRLENIQDTARRLSMSRTSI